MEKTNFEKKTNEILVWLDVNDAGALEPLIRMNIEIGRASTDPAELERYWASIRSLCGNMEKNPVRRGSPSKHSPETLANVDAVESRLITVFSSIEDADLILDIFHPRQSLESQGHYGSIESWAEHMAASGKRYMMNALNENRWDGELTDNLTNMALKEPKTTTKTEAPSDE